MAWAGTSAATILNESGVRAELYGGLHACLDREQKRSMCELIFKDSSQVPTASARVRCNATRFVGREGKECRPWLDRGKTRDEMKPARIVHAAARIFEKLRDDIAVDKDLRAKHVTIEGKVAGYNVNSEFRFTSHGRQFFDGEQQDLVVAYCANS